jgi:hypothetical protein
MLQHATISCFRARSISIPSTYIQCQRSFSLDVNAAKARASDWEPALRLPSKPHQGTKDRTPWMTTYSTFDPDMLRPLLMSGIDMGVKGIDMEVVVAANNGKTKEGDGHEAVVDAATGASRSEVADNGRFLVGC